MNVSHDSIEALQELCVLHSDDPTIRLRLANVLWETGREVAALAEARKSYAILKHDNPSEAADIVERFGDAITVDESFPPATKTYLPLAYFFKKKIKKHSVKLKKGTVLFTKGDSADFLYLVLDGAIAITAEENGIHAMVNYLHEGCLFGRCSLNNSAKHNVTSVAAEDSIVLMFTAKELQQAFDKFPDLQIQFSKDCLIRKRVELLSAIPAFSRIPMGLKFLLAKRCWTVNYAKKEVIKHANELMPNVGFILKGVALLHDEHDGQAPIYCGRMRRSDIVGLPALMHKGVGSLSITAETECELLCMSFQDAEDLMDLQSRVRKKLRETAVAFSDQITRTILLQKKIESKA